MELAVLGPVELSDGSRVVEAGSPQQRLVLAALALDAGRLVPMETLIGRVWDNVPEGARRTLYVLVTKIRRLLEQVGQPGACLLRQSGGYVLAIDPAQVDALRFRQLVSQARGAEPDRDARLRVLRKAVGLWRGEPLSGLAGEWAARTREVWRHEYLETVLIWAQHEIDAGNAGSVIGRLTELAGEHQLMEPLTGALMRALYAAGRQAEALSRYADIRERLVAELGTDPGAELQAVHREILRGRPEVGTAAGQTALTQLPPDLAVFTGRDEELAEMTASVDAAPEGNPAIHAVEGMPGVGKTALAVRAAHLLAHRFPDGQLFVDLHAHTPGREPTPPVAALATLLIAQGVDARNLPDDLDARAAIWRDRLSGKRILLVLDNAASSEQVAQLLPGHPTCQVIVTSRRHLGDLPGRVKHIGLTVLPADRARSMFYRLDPLAPKHPPTQVDELVTLAGNLPLAISMVAKVHAKHPAWTLTDLLTEMRLRPLTITAERSTIAAAFDLSYRHLAADRQKLLRCLGLHPGPEVDPYGAAALADIPVAEAAEHLEVLHGNSLLIEVKYRRFAMHDLVRRYAGALATTDPAQDQRTAVERLMDYYQDTAAIADAKLALPSRAVSTQDGGRVAEHPDLTSPAEALAWLRTERANISACLAHTSEHRRIVGLCASLAEVLRVDGPWSEAIQVHTSAVQAGRNLDDPLALAEALNDLGDIYCRTGQYPEAMQVLREARDLHQEIGHRHGQARSLTTLGMVCYLTGEYPRAVQDLKGALAMYQEAGHRCGQATALSHLGNARRLGGDYTAAREAQREALNLYGEIGHVPGQAIALTNLGNVQRLTGNYKDAGDVLRQALDLYRALGNRLGQANVLRHLGNVQRVTGDYQVAAQTLLETLDLYRALGNRIGEANVLQNLGAVWRRDGDSRAEPALRQSLDLCRELGDRGGEVEAMNEIGAIHRLNGDLGAARDAHLSAMELSKRIGSVWDEAHALAGLGRCALAAGRRADSAGYLRQALAIFQRLGTVEAGEVRAELDALTRSAQDQP